MQLKLTGPGLRLGLGLVSIGRVWGVRQSAPPDADEAQKLLSRAVELGIAIFDTAPAYAESEARLGRFLAGLEPSRRQALTIMTKMGEHWDFERGTSYRRSQPRRAGSKHRPEPGASRLHRCAPDP